MKVSVGILKKATEWENSFLEPKEKRGATVFGGPHRALTASVSETNKCDPQQDN